MSALVVRPEWLFDGSPIEDTFGDGERAVLEALRGMAYGQVEVVVHSSRIVQITRSQKLRFDGDAG